MINARTSKWFNYLIKLSFGVALLGALFYNIGISKIYQTLSEFSLWWLVPLFLLNIAILLLGAFNFIILLKGSETTVPYITLVRYYIISTTIGLFVPGKLGEFSMAFFLNKEGQPLGEATAINVLDKVVTLFLLSFIAVIGAFFYLTQSAAVKLLLSIVLLILFSLFLISRIGRKLVKKLILRKYSYKFKGFSASMRHYLTKNTNLLCYDTLSTFVKLILQSGVVYYLFVAFGEVVAFHNVFFINALLIIISLIPISIGGLGVREGSSILLFGALGIPALTTISVQIIFLLLRYFQGLLAIIFLLNKETFSWKYNASS